MHSLGVFFSFLRILYKNYHVSHVIRLIKSALPNIQMPNIKHADPTPQAISADCGNESVSSRLFPREMPVSTSQKGNR